MPAFWRPPGLNGNNGENKECLRIYYVAARNGHLPLCLSYVNPFLHTPIPAVLTTVYFLLCILTINQALLNVNYSIRFH